MPLNYAAEVVRLAAVTDPIENPRPEDWARTEAELGFILPVDIKAVVSSVGVGCFGTGVYVRNPTASSPHIRLSVATLLRYREPVLDLEQRGRIRLYPSPLGLVNIGGMD